MQSCILYPFLALPVHHPISLSLTSTTVFFLAIPLSMSLVSSLYCRYPRSSSSPYFSLSPSTSLSSTDIPIFSFHHVSPSFSLSFSPSLSHSPPLSPSLLSLIYRHPDFQLAPLSPLSFYIPSSFRLEKIQTLKTDPGVSLTSGWSLASSRNGVPSISPHVIMGDSPTASGLGAGVATKP